MRQTLKPTFTGVAINKDFTDIYTDPIDVHPHCPAYKLENKYRDKGQTLLDSSTISWLPNTAPRQYSSFQLHSQQCGR